LLIIKISDLDLIEVAELNKTLRNEGGFGSTDNTYKILSAKKTKIDDTTPTNIFKWTKINNSPTKITIQLPWNDYYSKGHIQKCNNGFQYSSINDPEIQHILPPHHVKSMSQSNKILLGHKHKINESISTSNKTYPIKITIDTPLSHIPTSTTMTIDQLRKAFGFRNVTSILNEIKATSQNLHLSTLDKEPIIDIGTIATIDKRPRNTHPLVLPKQLGDVLHMDIIYGSGTALQGIKYCLFAVDRATRHKFVYPLQSLQTDIVPAINNLIKDIGCDPKLIRTDFDHKLMGSKVIEYLQNKSTILQSAPPDQQNVNGLCERNWRSILNMSRNWLASSLLPSEFWWHAMKRATEVSNYIPIKINNSLTTPHEQVYNCKPDLRNLLPMFSVAYPSYKSKTSTDAQTCKAILIGKSTTSNAYEFYHPATKNVLTSTTFKLDERLAAGPAFGLPYDGGLYFTKYCEYNDTLRPPTYAPEALVYVQLSNNTYTQVQIIEIPKTNLNIYTIQYPDGSIHKIHEKHIHPSDPNIHPTSNDPPLRNIPK